MIARRLALLLLLLNGLLMCAIAWRVTELRAAGELAHVAAQQRSQRPPEWSSSRGPR
jgi:hypothetical protein